MTDTHQPPLLPLQTLDQHALEALRERVLSSGELGRSRIYARLFDYLMEASSAGRSPKEIEIAISVLGRDSDFDVTRDSVVRVYIHQLRKRLRRYYERHEPDARYELTLPRGQYLFAIADHQRGRGAAAARRPSGRYSARGWLAGLTLLLLVSMALNVVWWPPGLSVQDPAPTERGEALFDHPMWSNIADDALPLMIVMGDYYIFGEQNQEGQVTRMIRDFDINSPADLAASQENDTASSSYVDLSMTYMPEGSAQALALIAPVAERAGKPVEVRMMSQLTSAELRSHHVIYIGYISGLELLEPLYFGASGLRVGQSYDQLYHPASRELFTSNAARAADGETPRDLSLLATVPAINNNQLIIVAGTRDPGLREAARIVIRPDRLREIDSSLSLTGSRNVASQEALFRVTGTTDMISNVELLYSGTLDPTRIWTRQIE